MSEPLNQVAAALGGDISARFVLSRSGHPLLALPYSGPAALRALNLYQPQRGLAKGVAGLLRAGARFGLHRLLPKKNANVVNAGGSTGLLPTGVHTESVGILFGSADHKVFRSVLSYQNEVNWEVAKLAAGSKGAAMLEREAAVMREIGPVVPEAPELLGLESSGSSRLLRMPYLCGHSLKHGDVEPVLTLLQSWISDSPPEPLRSFSEWTVILKGLKNFPAGGRYLEKVADLPIKRSIRHGDLARWNLLRTNDGSLKVLDWEWGEQHGLPGIDLVHYLAQDFRLVQRLPAEQVIEKTVKGLEAEFWKPYLDQTGWAGHATELAIACFAFKQGASHQDNTEILRVARF